MRTRAFFAAAIGLLPALLTPAFAGDYPTDKPISLVLPFAPGGPSDVIARLIADKLSTGLGQKVLVVNTPGAGGMVASSSVARAAPDGYTLFYPNASTLTIAPQLRKEKGPMPLEQFVPVAPVLQFSLVLVANPGVQANDLQSLVQYARQNPGKVSYASPGVGTTPHLAAEMLEHETGISMLHVPYNGGSPAVLATVAGEVNLFFEQPLTILPHLKTGKLKALVSTGSQPLPLLPDVPTATQAGYPDLTLESWSAIVAPAGTPPAIVERLNQEVNKVLAQPEVQQAITSRGLEPTPGTPQDLARRIQEDWPRWSALIKNRNIVVN